MTSHKTIGKPTVSESCASANLLARRIREELEAPDDITGQELLMLAYGLHGDLRNIRAVGGREIDLRPYVTLLLDVFTSFRWSVHVR